MMKTLASSLSILAFTLVGFGCGGPKDSAPESPIAELDENFPEIEPYDPQPGAGSRPITAPGAGKGATAARPKVGGTLYSLALPLRAPDFITNNTASWAIQDLNRFPVKIFGEHQGMTTVAFGKSTFAAPYNHSAQLSFFVPLARFKQYLPVRSIEKVEIELNRVYYYGESDETIVCLMNHKICAGPRSSEMSASWNPAFGFSDRHPGDRNPVALVFTTTADSTWKKQGTAPLKDYLTDVYRKEVVKLAVSDYFSSQVTGIEFSDHVFKALEEKPNALFFSIVGRVYVPSGSPGYLRIFFRK